jgi:hypothetical protein
VWYSLATVMLPIGTKIPCSTVLPASAAVLLRSPLPRPHPAAPAGMTNMDSTTDFTKTKRRQFDMGPPGAGDAGAMDALSTTRAVYPKAAAAVLGFACTLDIADRECSGHARIPTDWPATSRTSARAAGWASESA